MIIAFIISSMFVITFAAQQVTINNTGSISNVNTNMFMTITGVTATTTCSASTGAYTDTGLALVWNVQVGGSQTQYACLDNTGSALHTISISQTGLPTGVTFTGSSNPATVPAGGFALVTLSVT